MVKTRSSQCMLNTHVVVNEDELTNSFLEEESRNNLKPLFERRNYFDAKIDMRSSYRVIDEIKKKLTPSQTELFGRTCFGHFLKLESLVFSGKLVHQILLRLLESPDGDSSLHFRLGDKQCTFRLEDFALITGLDCREFDSPDAVKAKLSDRFRCKYFPGRERVTVEEIARVFKTYSGSSDDDAVKLAQLYLLEGFLLSKRDGVLCEDDLFIRLVEDASEFDRFPWGRCVYKYTLNSLKLRMKSLVERKKSEYFKPYFLGGFPQALQVWAFECIPILGERFARRIGYDMPRMLNWALVGIPKKEEVESALDSGKFSVERGLHPRDEELCKDYFHFFLEKRISKNGKSENCSEVCIEVDDRDDEKVPDDTARSDANPAASILKLPARALKPLLEKRNSVKATFVMPSSYQVIDEIKNKLTRRQSELFKKTCFGQFLKLQSLRLSRQLVHQILLRQVVRPVDESSMYFRILDKEYEFSLRDFELITGLNCREYEASDGAIEVKPSDRFRNKYFRGIHRASITDISQAFRGYSGNSDGDAVKLALLYLLEAFLLSKPPNVPGDDDFIGFVDDAGEFDRFPWGRYVYRYTVKSMKGAMYTRAEKHGSSTGYLLRGFPQVLQFWAFEHLPVVRERFSRRLGFDVPLMLNWGLGKSPRNEEVESIFNGVEITSNQNLKGSERDRKMKRKSKRNIDKGESLKGEAEKAIINGTSHQEKHDDWNAQEYDDDAYDDNDDDDVDEELIREEVRSMLRIELNKAFSLQKDEVRARLMTETIKQQRYFAIEDDEQDERPPQIKRIRGTYNIHCCTIGLSERPNHDEKAEFDKRMKVGLKSNNKLMRETRNNVVSINVDEDDDQDECPSQRNRNPVTDDTPCFTVDLFEHPDDDEKAEFDEWIKAGLKRNKKKKYSVTSNEINPAFDFGIMKCDKKDWFVSLNKTAEWLSSSHIDVALHFMRKKKANHPELSKHRCTTTDTLFHARLSSRYSDFKRDPEGFLWHKEPLVQKTVQGIEPSHSLPWLGVDFVYAPVNAGKKHWVLAALDLRKRRLQVYDSYHAAKHYQDVLSACRPIAEMIPWLLNSVGFFDPRSDIHAFNGATEPWEVEHVRAIPQQENGGDCGIFMLKFVEFLMQGTSLEKCSSEEIPFFRNKMAVELYTYGKKTVTSE